MRAELISVGTELLLGDITDTNSTFLARELAALGIDLYYISNVGDNPMRLTQTIATARKRSDLIIITGGLGPTSDDITRDSVAKAFGLELERKEELLLTTMNH